LNFKTKKSISQKLKAKELVAEINYCYGEFDKIITNYRIEKIISIGDSNKCVGRLPTPHESHPIDMVGSGIAFQECISKKKELKIKQNKSYFELRSGIYICPDVAGIVGIIKFAYDIWADTVNTALRLQTNGTVEKVNISGATHHYIKDYFECTYRAKI